MASHSSILAWRIPWTEEPSGLQFMGCKESNTTERLTPTVGPGFVGLVWWPLSLLWGLFHRKRSLVFLKMA